MVNEEILGGIKLAVLKGQSLKDAMMSFYRAGYPKQEIEDAARAFQLEQYNAQMARMQAQQGQQKKGILPFLGKKSPAPVVQHPTPIAPSFSPKTSFQTIPKAPQPMNKAIESKSVSSINVPPRATMPAPQKEPMLNKTIEPSMFSKPQLNPPTKPEQKPAQPVSDYSSTQQSSKGKLTLLVIILMVLIILSVAAGFFVFSEEILGLFK